MGSENNIKILVVDDTIVYRKILTDVLSEIPGLTIVGTANNGKIAMMKLEKLKPDLVTLDVEMPEMNGLEVLAEIKNRQLDVGAIMLSALTHEGSEITIKALELGAFDFVPKPQSSANMSESKKIVKDILKPMLQAFIRRREIQNILKGRHKPDKSRKDVDKTEEPVDLSDNVIRSISKLAKKRHLKSEVVAIGISTGGPNALAQMMPMLPPDLGVPILIVQHMPPVFTESLAKSLNSKCKIKVREARDEDILTANTAFIAPGGKQMKVAKDIEKKQTIIRITDDAPENSCKPSADYLFRSIAHRYQDRSTGVIMTGMGSDGNHGLRLMKRNGSVIIAQNQASCTVFGMPKAPIESGIVDVIAPLEQIASEIMRTLKVGR